MARGKLRVSRKGYTRRGYTRKDGTRVKAARVPGSAFTIKDRGLKGRGPKTLPPIKRQGALNNIAMKHFGKTFTQLDAEQEKTVLRVANRRFGKKAVRGMLQWQVNIRGHQRSAKVERARGVFERGMREERML